MAETQTPVAEVVQVANGGFIVECRVHGRIVPEPGKVWTHHTAAGMACMSHTLFIFHGKGAR